MPKTKRSTTTFQHPLFGTIDHNLSGVFVRDSEVCGKVNPRSEYVLQNKTELHSDLILINLEGEIELYDTIREVYSICQKIKEEKAKDDAMWQEILAIIVAPNFNERSPSPDCDVELIPEPKRRRVLA
jgi:hypothetical protein